MDPLGFKLLFRLSSSRLQSHVGNSSGLCISPPPYNGRPLARRLNVALGLGGGRPYIGYRVWDHKLHVGFAVAILLLDPNSPEGPHIQPLGNWGP